MKVVFWGTPRLSVPFLEWLAAHHKVVAVVTQPDKPRGRSHVVQPTAVKETAQKLNIPVFTPEKLKDSGVTEALKPLAPDVGVLVSYGKILPRTLFALPKHGTLNIHFSLLPHYRGAAPIARSIMNGESKTGITSFWMDEGMDTGATLLQKEEPILDSDDAVSLEQKLIALGIQVLEESLVLVEKGQSQGRAQEGPATIAAKLTKEEGRIDWKKPARSLRNLIRGAKPWPGAYTGLPNGRALKIEEAELWNSGPQDGPTGRVAGLERLKGFVVKCGEGSLLVTKVVAEGKKPSSAWDFWQGARLNVGALLGEQT